MTHLHYHFYIKYLNLKQTALSSDRNCDVNVWGAEKGFLRLLCILIKLHNDAHNPPTCMGKLCDRSFLRCYQSLRVQTSSHVLPYQNLQIWENLILRNTILLRLMTKNGIQLQEAFHWSQTRRTKGVYHAQLFSSTSKCILYLSFKMWNKVILLLKFD